ncbi:MAG: FtsX-like permease family protein, partial [Calditrichaeota bacterium]|nr:FtsX-like permease family protein [Calditrichota bacterium]
YYTYVLLPPEYPASELERKFARLDVHADYGEGKQLFIHLQPLTDIHFYSHLKHELQANGNSLYVYVFSAIALFVLLIACINFMNLSTARSSRRMREIGMRKVLGAYRSQLIGQFLAESIIVCFLALALALGIVEIGLPYFNTFSGKMLALNTFDAFWFIAILPGLALLVGLISGSYPAFFLSSFQPVSVLKGHLNGREISFSTLLRKGLIVFQFTISIALIIGTVVVYHQMQFVKNQDLGFNKEQIVVLSFLWDAQIQDKYATLKNQLLENANVLGVTASGDIPGRMWTAMSYKVEGMAEDEWGGITALIVDPDFSETYEIPIVAG